MLILKGSNGLSPSFGVTSLEPKSVIRKFLDSGPEVLVACSIETDLLLDEVFLHFKWQRSSDTGKLIPAA